jgi:hypothetical protein
MSDRNLTTTLSNDSVERQRQEETATAESNFGEWGSNAFGDDKSSEDTRLLRLVANAAAQVTCDSNRPYGFRDGIPCTTVCLAASIETVGGRRHLVNATAGFQISMDSNGRPRWPPARHTSRFRQVRGFRVLLDLQSDPLGDIGSIYIY